MSKFCQLCGKELVDGNCDCNESNNQTQAEETTTRQPIDSKPDLVENEKPTQETAPEKSTIVPVDLTDEDVEFDEDVEKKSSFDKEKVIKYLKDYKDMTIGVFKSLDKTVEASKKYEQNQILIFAGAQLLLTFIIALITKFPMVSEFITMGGRFKLAFFYILMVILAVVVPVGAELIIAKAKTKEDIISHSGKFVVFATPVLCATVIAFILSYLSAIAYVFVMLIGILMWVMLCNESVKEALADKKDYAYIITAVYTAIIWTVIIFASKSFAADLIASSISSMFSSLF